MGDEIELGAVERLFGNAAGKLAMSSTKSATGHLLGAAGAVEAIFSVLAIRDNIAPPTLNLDNPSVETAIDLVPHKAKKREIDTVLSNSFGFGGTNASLDAAPPRGVEAASARWRSAEQGSARVDARALAPAGCQRIVLSPHLPSSCRWRIDSWCKNGARHSSSARARLSGADHEKPPAGGPAHGPLRQPHGRHAGAQPVRAAGADAPAGQAARAARTTASRAASRPFLRFLNGLLTFVLAADAGCRRRRPTCSTARSMRRVRSSSQDGGDPQGRGRARDRLAAGARRRQSRDRRLFIAGYLWSKFASMAEGGKPVQLKAGDYEVKQNASVRQIIDMLSEGKTMSYRVTIPEGLTSYQIVERLKADAEPRRARSTPCRRRARCCPRPSSSSAACRRQAIVDSMQAEARKVAGESVGAAQEGPAAQDAGGGDHAGLDRGEGDRARRRARAGRGRVHQPAASRTCGCSPIRPSSTAWRGGKAVWSRPIQKGEIGQKTSHNTYQIDGLPPTPICNPGRAAIEAVLNPADTNELYFVADGTGGHVFSETLKDHNANVAEVARRSRRSIKAQGGAAPAADTPTTAAPRRGGRRRPAPSCAPCRRPRHRPSQAAPEAGRRADAKAKR